MVATIYHKSTHSSFRASRLMAILLILFINFGFVGFFFFLLHYSFLNLFTVKPFFGSFTPVC